MDPGDRTANSLIIADHITRTGCVPQALMFNVPRAHKITDDPVVMLEAASDGFTVVTK